MPVIDDSSSFGALLILEYLESLFTASPRPMFTKTELLVILNEVKNDPEMFSPEALEAFQTVEGEPHV